MSQREPRPTTRENSKTRNSVIAIDGPSASGKTVAGKRLAKCLGFRFVDTGAMYRAITLLALELKIDLEDGVRLTELAQSTTLELSTDSDLHGATVIRADGRDLTDKIRSPQVDRAVSQVSKVLGVRAAMVKSQRELAQQGNVVMVGRDIGTVVLADLALKIFLTASSEERAMRRYKELTGQKVNIQYNDVLLDLQRRDEIDSSRPVSPLRPAPDAHLVNTDDLSIDQVIEAICDIVKRA